MSRKSVTQDKRRPSTVSAEQVRDRLAEFQGFREGYDQRSKIIRLGSLLRQLREQEVNISQSEAAAALGIDQSELSRIESGRGERGPSFGRIARIIETYSEMVHQHGGEVNLTIEVSSPGQQTRYSLTAVDDNLSLAGEP